MLNAEPVLIVCSEEASHGQVVESVLNCGLDSLSCSDCREARSLLERQSFEVVLCSDSLADGDLWEVIKVAKPTPVVVVTEHTEWSRYLAALHAGAFDCLTFPPDGAQVKRTLWSALIEHARLRRRETTATLKGGNAAL